MLKTFTLWMEDVIQQKRLTNALLRNLGYKTDAISNQDVILKDREFRDIVDAIKRLDIDEDNKEEMIKFANSHKNNLSLKALANQIKFNDVETQDTLSSIPAVLPQGQQPAPKPINKQQMMMQQQNQPPMAAGFVGF